MTAIYPSSTDPQCEPVTIHLGAETGHGFVKSGSGITTGQGLVEG